MNKLRYCTHRILASLSHKTIAIFVFSLSFTLLLSACGGGNSSDPDNTDSGGGSITVNATSGVTPDYSWNGGKVMSVTVVRTSAPTTPVWGVVTAGTDGISSTVTQGQTPTGALQTFAVENTLTAGVEYRVSVARIDGTSFGFTEFTPAGTSSSASYSVGGDINGLSGTLSLSLAVNGTSTGDLSDVQSNAFAFSTTLANGDSYIVSISGQPAGQTCVVINGSGTVSGSDISATINCATSGPSKNLVFTSDLSGIYKIERNNNNTAVKLTGDRFPDYMYGSPDQSLLAYQYHIRKRLVIRSTSDGSRLYIEDQNQAFPLGWISNSVLLAARSPSGAGDGNPYEIITIDTANNNAITPIVSLVDNKLRECDGRARSLAPDKQKLALVCTQVITNSQLKPVLVIVDISNKNLSIYDVGDIKAFTNTAIWMKNNYITWTTKGTNAFDGILYHAQSGDISNTITATTGTAGSVYFFSRWVGNSVISWRVTAVEKIEIPSGAKTAINWFPIQVGNIKLSDDDTEVLYGGLTDLRANDPSNTSESVIFSGSNQGSW